MTHMYTHPCPPLILRAHERTCARHLQPFQECFHYTHIHTSSCLLEFWLKITHTYTPVPMPTLDWLHKHIFLLHVYRSVFLARMRRYTQLAYLFHQCETSRLSRDGRIADCTVRHPGVGCSFSSCLCDFVQEFV